MNTQTNLQSNQGQRQSWSVKDEAIHDELATMMDLTDDEKATLGTLNDEASSRAREMTEAFYARLFAHENTKEYFAEADMDRLHSMIGEWYADLFSGTYDAEYVKHRLGIGYIHVKIGLPVRYPLAMLDVVQEHGEQICETADDPELAKQAFRKALALDIAIFNQAYEDNQLKHLAELVGGERLARRLLMGI
jgi:hypothetical protein